MEQKTIDLVQGSFEKVKPIAETAAKIFYDKLFALDPALKPLFPSGEDAMASQGNKYDTVGAALLGTLEAGLGDDFTPDVKEAWTTVYGTMSSVMIKASY